MSGVSRLGTARAMTLLEKARYPFSAYPRQTCREVLFPGCALPSQLPRTTDALAELARTHGLGVVYDCCGKPLADWDAPRAAERALARLRRRLGAIGCERLVVACPNCLDYLQGRLGIACTSVYEELGDWGLGSTGGRCAGRTRACESHKPVRAVSPGVLFSPCPDRATRTLERQIRTLADFSAVPTLSGAPCCGLRGDVAARGPAAVRACTARVLEKADGQRVYTYCASCSGQLARCGAVGVRHALSVLLGVDEEPDHARALANRARRRLDRRLEPYPVKKGDERP